MWHGALENDGFRRAWLAEIAAAGGSPWRAQADAPTFAGRRDAMINKLADAIEDNTDLELLVGGAR